MRAILKPGVLVLTVENEAEREAFDAWRSSKEGHVFLFDGGADKGGALHDLGPREDACNQPINIVFDQTTELWRPISNLSHTPFVMHGRAYASVEGFWQGLKWPDDKARARTARLWGKAARNAGDGAPAEERFTYDGRSLVFGAAGHRALMAEACEAKFTQNAEARVALLATGERPLTHRVRRDSQTIPGALMADIWMRIRERLRDVPVSI